MTIFRIIGKSKSKCYFHRVAGSGFKIQDFMMILLAMFDRFGVRGWCKVYIQADRLVMKYLGF